ncbi:MAG: flagellar hook-associated protein FlgK [Gammaproteobacteria bacterium 39-13]|nr:flagellar hook-associated protein FlgK [Gammaproteobacteria bacterium]OJV86602.1 MAG: flagellar hook-associated protein FlgK [Gammaproteobacteria bacterium 39-13]
MSDMLAIGTTGLLAAQQTLNTISHNIANVNTPGYSRQVTSLAANLPRQAGNGFVGSGVGILGTNRVVDEFLIESLRNQQAVYNQFDAYATNLQDIEGLFYDGKGGIAQTLSQFFNSLQDLSNDPSSISARQVFISQGEILASQINELSTQLQNEVSNINQQLAQNAIAVNGIAQKISVVNQQISFYAGNSAGDQPNDLFDLRDQYLFELSQYVGVSTNVQNDGSLNVFIGNGQSLVLGTALNTLGTKPNSNDASLQDITIGNENATQVVSSFISGGTMGGLLALRDSIISNSLNELGRISISLASAFNAQHVKGIDLNGNFGIEIFNDPNAYIARLNRVYKDTGNTGSAVFGVAIDPINPFDEEISTFSQASNIVNAGSLTALVGNMLSLNNINIRAATAADDTVSTSDALASAIAIANTINSQSAAHLVTAIAQPNALYLGTFTPGALVAGNLSINGVNVISTGVNEQIILQDINALTSQTGVQAVGDGAGNITLVADDGRNIQLTKTLDSTGATFTYFDISAGGARDNVQRANVKLISQNDDPIFIGGNNPAGVGFTTGSVPTVYPGLTADDYELTYNGTFYTLRNLSSSKIVAQTTVPILAADGFVVSLESGTIANGDSFVIKPTRSGAGDFSFRITDPTTIAIAMPIKAQATVTNKGTGQILVSDVVNTSGVPLPTATTLGNAFSEPSQITPPIRIEFITPMMYRVYDMSFGGNGKQIGQDQIYNPNNLYTDVFPLSSVVDLTPPGPKPTYVYDPGYRITLQGIPQAGDTFTIEYNANADGDNRNGIKLVNLQFEKLMQNNTATFQETYSQLVAEIGTESSQGIINRDASFSIFNAIQSNRNQISGVNLDEEATKLLGFQQAYQAAAQIILVARSNFDALIRVFN